MKKINSSKKLSFKFGLAGEVTPPWRGIPTGLDVNSPFPLNPKVTPPWHVPLVGGNPYEDIYSQTPDDNSNVFNNSSVPTGQMGKTQVERDAEAANKLIQNTKMKKNLRNAYIGSTVAGAGINQWEKQQALQNSREYTGFMGRPNTNVNQYMYGDNQNSENLSISDTALTRKGALINKFADGGIANILAKNKFVKAELEKKEAFTTPDGVTTHLKDEPTHEEGGWTAEYNGKEGLPEGTQVYSDDDTMRPSKLVDIKKLSDTIGIKLKDNKITYAGIVKKIDDKYGVAKNTEILQSKKYDTQFKQSAQAMINKANVLKDNVIFPIQQSHNGNSNGQEKLTPMYKKGGVVDIDENEINRLKQLGYEFNTL